MLVPTLLRGNEKIELKNLSARYSELCCFAFLATHFFFCSKKEVSKKMPFPVTCPQKARVPENAMRQCFALDKFLDGTIFVAGSCWSAIQAHHHSKSHPCDFAPA